MENIRIRQYKEADLPELIRIWNQIVEDGVAFPQEELLTDETGKNFFESQTYTAAAEGETSGKIYGLYILHPNNVGRCGHICNASYAVDRDARGLHIGEKLVKDCLMQGKEHGYAFFSLMRSLRRMSMRDIFTNGSVLRSLVSSRKASG